MEIWEKNYVVLVFILNSKKSQMKQKAQKKPWVTKAFLDQWLSNLLMHQSHSEDLLKHICGPHSRVSDIVGVQCRRMCFSNRFLGYANAAKRPHFQNPL